MESQSRLSKFISTLSDTERRPIDLRSFELDKYLQSLFLLYSSLKKSSSTQEVDSDLISLVEITLRRALFEAVNRRSVIEVGGMLQMRGVMFNGADILPLIEPELRRFFEELKITEKETLGNIPLLGVVGKIASGKGTVASFLDEQFDILAFPLSGRLKDLALLLYGGEYSRENLIDINNILKPEFGKEVFVDWTLDLAKKQAELLHPDLIVVDGFRSLEETEFFLSFPDTHLIGIVASQNPEEDLRIRFERQRARARGNEDYIDFESFQQADERERAWVEPILELIRERGFPIIVNSGTIEEFQKQVFQVVSTIFENE